MSVIRSVEAPTRKSETKSKSKTSAPWQVVVLDDPVNLMEYVTRVLMRIFGHSREQAEQLMMDVHTRGRAIVWTGNREKGEMYVQQLHQAQLHASLEKAQ